MAKKFRACLQAPKSATDEIVIEVEGRGFNDVTSKLITVHRDAFMSMTPNGLIGIENLSSRAIKFFKRGGSSDTIYPISDSSATVVMHTAG